MIKNFIKCFIVLALLIAVVNIGYAQKSEEENGDYACAITVNPLSMLFGVINAEANIRLAASVSLILGGSYYSLSSGSWNVTAVGVGTGLKYYWQQTAVHKWYIGPIVDIAFASSEYESLFTGNTASGSATGTSFGGLIGYQSIFDSGFTLDVGIGVQVISIPSVSVNIDGSKINSGTISWTLPLIKFSVGYAF